MPDIERVKECTQQRVTLIGHGTIRQNQEVVFDYPLPQCLQSKTCKNVSQLLCLGSLQLILVIKYIGKHVYPSHRKVMKLQINVKKLIIMQ